VSTPAILAELHRLLVLGQRPRYWWQR